MRTVFSILAALATACALVLPDNATANTIAYDGSSISFDGSGNFNIGTFDITSGAAAGLQGNISGTFSIGSISTFFGVSAAPVSGTGILSISDGSQTLTGSLTWVDIVQAGTLDGLNITGTVNLTGIAYSGSNADLLALASAGSATDTLSFTFSNGTTLSQLATTQQSDSFAGSITPTSVPDGGATIALLGFGLLGLEGVRRQVRNQLR